MKLVCWIRYLVLFFEKINKIEEEEEGMMADLKKYELFESCCLINYFMDLIQFFINIYNNYPWVAIYMMNKLLRIVQ